MQNGTILAEPIINEKERLFVAIRPVIKQNYNEQAFKGFMYSFGKYNVPAFDWFKMSKAFPFLKKQS